MVTESKYKYISDKFGHFASWAIWKEQEEKPKSNVGDLSIFDLDNNPGILSKLKTNFIMVGLNISRPIEYKFGNFHDKRPRSQDYKIRYAFKDSIFSGAYMTDIIKDFENVVSGEVMKFLKSNPEFERKNIDTFIQEMNDIEAKQPVFLAFGSHTFSLLNKYFNGAFQIIKFPHYSMRNSMENYRIFVDKIINDWNKR